MDLVEQFEVTGAQGVQLVGDRRGRAGAPTVVFLHGGGQTRHSWRGTADAVADRGWTAVTVDARGHGESEWSPDGTYRLPSFAEDLAAVVASLDPPVVLVGASM